MAHFERSSLTMGVTVTGRVSTQYNFGKTRIYIYIFFLGKWQDEMKIINILRKIKRQYTKYNKIVYERVLRWSQH